MIDKIIFKYLDDNNLIILNSETDVYFVEDINYKYAQIRLTNTGICFIVDGLIEEISAFFSMGYIDSKEVIGRWVGNTLQTEVTSSGQYFGLYEMRVGNTLQTEVTSNPVSVESWMLPVGDTLQTETTSTLEKELHFLATVGNTLQTEVTSTKVKETRALGLLQILKDINLKKIKKKLDKQ
jgi:hypothetical protein